MWKIQNYSTVDCPGLLAVRAAIAAAATKNGTETSTELQAQLEFPGRDPSRDVYLAHDNADVIGFGWIHPEPAIGVAVAELGLLPRYRRRGIGLALLESLIEAAKRRSLDELRLRVDSSEEGLAAFLAHNGFRAIRDYVIMRASHTEMLAIPRTDSANVMIRPFAAPDDIPALTVIQNAAFSGSFGFCPNTVEQVSAYLAMRGDHEGLFFAIDSDRDEIVGYVWSSLHDSARIEMIGVRPDARQQGVASVLLSTAVLAQERRGATSVELEVDANNHSAIALYERYGFRQTGESVCFGRDLAR